MKEKESLKETFKELSDNEALLVYYDEDEENEKIYKTNLEYAKEEGEKLGEKIGISKKAKDIAKSMLNDNIGIDVIAKYTNLSINEISKLKQC